MPDSRRRIHRAVETRWNTDLKEVPRLSRWFKMLESFADTISGNDADRDSTTANQANLCRFWDCDKIIKPDHLFCYIHFQDRKLGKINECTDCQRYKSSRFPKCKDCFQKNQPVQQNASLRNSHLTSKRYQREHSTAWEAGDAKASVFYVYILKLDGGYFYAGQTRELRERLSEHRDGRTRTTAGRNPKLVWFAEVPTRNDAADLEVDLKKVINSNPRAIRRLTLDFKDIVNELDFS